MVTGLVAGLVRWSEDPPPSITSAFSRNSERGEGYCWGQTNNFPADTELIIKRREEIILMVTAVILNLE